MDEVLKVLRAIVSSFSEFGSIPKPIRVCVALFSGIFGFSLIFVYAHLTRQQTIYLILAITIMAVVTGVYYLVKRGSPKQTAEGGGEWGPSPSAKPRAAAPSEPRQRSRASETEHFWDAPSSPRPAHAERGVLPVPQGRSLAGPSTSLLELTEPILQYVCRLNRIARRGQTGKSEGTTTFLLKSAATGVTPASAAPTTGLDEVVVRSEVKALIEDLMAKASRDVQLADQVRKIELPLIFFVDSMIAESALPFAAQWNQNRLAYDRQELAGDEKFFDLLEETLQESSEAAAERLSVFYACIGLGFTGIYFKQPELLRKTMLSIAPRIRHLVENDATARICPETYQGVDTRNLVEPPSGRMVLVGLVFGCFTLAVLISYGIMYRQASRNLNNSIGEVLRQDLAVGTSQ